MAIKPKFITWKIAKGEIPFFEQAIFFYHRDMWIWNDKPLRLRRYQHYGRVVFPVEHAVSILTCHTHFMNYLPELTKARIWRDTLDQLVKINTTLSISQANTLLARRHGNRSQSLEVPV